MRVQTDRGVLVAPKDLINLLVIATSEAAEYNRETSEIYRDLFGLTKQLYEALEKEGYYD